jgi:Xaa-Pro aminopeptidase
VRIEDDYVMSDEGAVCLSFDLPKTIEDIEEFMKNT